MSEKQNTIFFVGAGPGDPDLITVKGRKLISEADLIIYTGSLVPETLLTDTKAQIRNSAIMNLDEIIACMKEAWQTGKKVVRLHTGDPSIYGAIGEQMERLAKQKIPFKVIPGVSSVMAAAAALSAELTLPEISQTVIITRKGGRTPVPEKEQLSRLASHQATMLILLSISMIEEVILELLAGGYDEDTPVAVVEKASWPEQRIIRGRLNTIAEKVKNAGINKTAVIAIGKVLEKGITPPRSKLYDPHFKHGCREAGKIMD